MQERQPPTQQTVSMGPKADKLRARLLQTQKRDMHFVQLLGLRLALDPVSHRGRSHRIYVEMPFPKYL